MFSPSIPNIWVVCALTLIGCYQVPPASSSADVADRPADVGGADDADADGTLPDAGGVADTSGSPDIVVDATCQDDVQNQDESDVDCGGSCDPCSNGEMCSGPLDCDSGSCLQGRCAPPSCMDTAMNGTETDVDCGGGCLPCTTGQSCRVGTDCGSGRCEDSSCAEATCDDGVQNATETDVDCGGDDCPGCGAGQSCDGEQDCASTLCDADVCVIPTSCADYQRLGVGNGDGDYYIDPDGPLGLAPLTEVYCDMTTDGGVGYTMLRLDDPDLLEDQQSYRDACAALGLEVIVPRSRSHAESITAFNGGDPPNLVNVYPRYDGAEGLNNWTGKCQGADCRFYLADGNAAGCDGPEPSGDNTVDDALYRYGEPAPECPFGSWNDSLAGEVDLMGHVLCSTNDVGPPMRQSCLEIQKQGEVRNTRLWGIHGMYTVEPAGAIQPVEVYCNFLRDGGGYTYLKVEFPTEQNAAQAEAHCAQFGMQLFIPRTAAHLEGAFNVGRSPRIPPSAENDYLEIMGIYPNTDTSSCSYMPLNSDNAMCEFSASDGGPYFVHDRSDIYEPDGNQGSTADSLEYFWYSDGSISLIQDELPGVADAHRFICDVGDKLGP